MKPSGPVTLASRNTGRIRMRDHLLTLDAGRSSMGTYWPPLSQHVQTRVAFTYSEHWPTMNKQVESTFVARGGRGRHINALTRSIQYRWIRHIVMDRDAAWSCRLHLRQKGVRRIQAHAAEGSAIAKEPYLDRYQR